MDGDTTLGSYYFEDGTSISVSMPYLSGPDLCDISSLFGLPETYSWGGSNLSRWQYLDNLMAFCIKNRRCSDLLAYLFRKEQFTKMLSGRGAHEIDAAYNYIVHQTIETINGQLYFGGHELSVIGQQFLVKKIGAKVEVESPRIKSIDREYIKSIFVHNSKQLLVGNGGFSLRKISSTKRLIKCYSLYIKLFWRLNEDLFFSLHGSKHNGYSACPFSVASQFALETNMDSEISRGNTPYAIHAWEKHLTKKLQNELIH